MTDRDIILFFNRYSDLKFKYTQYIKSIIADTPAHKLPTMLEWYDNFHMRGDNK